MSKELVDQIEMHIKRDDITLTRIQINTNQNRMSIDIFGAEGLDLSNRKKTVRAACEMILNNLDKIHNTINFFELSD